MWIYLAFALTFAATDAMLCIVLKRRYSPLGLLAALVWPIFAVVVIAYAIKKTAAYPSWTFWDS